MSNEIKYQDFVKTLEFPPTAEQEKVITSNSPAILVIAGAGSGKTTTMSQRIAWKIVSGKVRPDQVLGLTFTHKAAGELAQSAYAEIAKSRSQLSIQYTQQNNFGNPIQQAEENLQPKNESTTLLSKIVEEVNIKQNSIDDEEDKEEKTDFREECDISADIAHTALMRPTISTYNSFAAEIATSYAMLIGEDPRSRLITEAERWQIMAEIVASTELPAENMEILQEESDETIIDSCLKMAAAVIDNDVEIAELKSYLQNELEIIEVLNEAGALNRKPFRGTEASKGFAVLKEGIPSIKFRLAITPYIEAYFKYKKENSVIEFSDQISWATKILQTSPAVAEKIREQYKLVLLDEYQDTSVNQARFLAQAFKGVDSVCAVGDPNQAIYGWRGASANALVDFVDFFNVAEEDQLTLYTSFRNPIAVLNAANKTTQGFAQEISAQELYQEFNELTDIGRPWTEEPIVQNTKRKIKLPKLTPKPNAPIGKVIHVHRHLQQDSYSAMAAQIATQFKALMQEKTGEKNKTAPTGAVLIRTHAIAENVAAALKAHNLEYEIVGGTPIITMPEIRALRSLLQLSVSANRNDCLVYLFNYFALGSADIAAFARLRKKIKQLQNTEETLAFTENINLLQVFETISIAKYGDRADIAQAQEEITKDIHDAQKIMQLARKEISEIGMQRIEYLAEAVKILRDSAYLSLPVLIRKAADLLQLPVMIASRLTGQAGIFGALNLFTQMSETYVNAGRGTKLSGFLDWIDEVEARERVGQENPGDDLALLEITEQETVIPGKVTILTVHAAKGLQWDVVAIPEMVAYKFDNKTKRGLAPWHKSKSKIPDVLRADVKHIPAISMQSIEFYNEDSIMCKGEAGCRYYDYLNRKLSKYYSDEQRRLAYVAFTRPKYALILGSYDYSSEKRAKQFLEKLLAGNKGAGKWVPTELSVFLNELLTQSPEDKTKNATYCSLDPDNEPLFDTENDFIAWAEKLADQQVAENEKLEKYWPRDVERNLIEARLAEEKISDEISAQIISEVRENMALLQNEVVENEITENKISYFTASGIVALIDDAEEFLRNQRRPIPAKPLVAARRGTIVHSQIANFFAAPQRFNIDEISDEQEMKIDPQVIQNDPQAQQLYARFEESRFVQLKPLAIEQSLEITIADIPVRCVVDAVFDTSENDSALPVTIVDWKTGARPRDADIEARQFQLTLYRYAWAHSTGVPVEKIDACFYYLGEKNPAQREFHVDLLSFQEMEKQIMQKLQQ